MDIPDLVKQALGDEEIQAGVSLGDEDTVCLTPTRTLVYRGEGLISDEQVEEYSHDIKQLAVSEGRRKTKFTMEYIDGTQSFTVPSNRSEKVLELFLEGVLRLEGVIEPRESLAGVYRFSELTLIIAEQRLVKHIGSQVWTEDYEVYPYEGVTELDFEQASVATSITLSIDGRPQRIKVPNDQAAVVRRTLEGALFDFYEVGTLEEFNRVVGGDDQAADTGGVADGRAEESGFNFGDDFDSLVSDDEELTESVDAGDQLASEDAGGRANADGPDRQRAEANSGTRSPDAQATQPTETPSEFAPENPQRRAADQNPTGEDSDDGGPAEQPESADPAPQPDQTGNQSADASARTTASSTDSQRPREATRTDESAQSRDQSTTPAGGERDAAQSSQAAGAAGTQSDETRQQPAEETAENAATQDADRAVTDATDAESAPVSREEYEAMAERLDELTEAVDRQNELLKRQHRALKQLVKQQSE